MKLLSLTIDARKLGDGGIGVYLENLIEGLLELKEDGLLNLELSVFVSPKTLAYNSTFFPYTSSLKSRGVKLIAESSKPYSISEYFFMARRHAQHLRKQDIFHTPHYVLPLGIPCKKVVTIHDVIHVEHPDTVLHKPIAKCLIKSAISRASAVITVSHYSKDRIKQIFTSAKKVSVVYNALQQAIKKSSKNLKVEERPNSFLFVGSDRPHKCFDVLLDAWKEFNARSEASLFVVGKSFSSATKKRVKEMGLSRSIHFLGEVSNLELNELYHAVDTAVITSIEEGFGLVALEALSAGAKVVSTPLESVKEFTSDSPVIYAKDFSAKAVAEALFHSLGQSKNSAAINRELFSRANFARSTLEIYEEVLSARLLTSKIEARQVA